VSISNVTNWPWPVVSNLCGRQVSLVHDDCSIQAGCCVLFSSDTVVRYLSMLWWADDVRSLSLPGTYHEKINCIGNSLQCFTRLKSLDLSRNTLASLAVSNWLSLVQFVYMQANFTSVQPREPTHCSIANTVTLDYTSDILVSLKPESIENESLNCY